MSCDHRVIDGATRRGISESAPAVARESVVALGLRFVTRRRHLASSHFGQRTMDRFESRLRKRRRASDVAFREFMRRGESSVTKTPDAGQCSASLLVALLILFVGSTMLASILRSAHPAVWFILFWFFCAWLTLTAVLLALFDLLLVRAQARRAKRLLSESIAASQAGDNELTSTVTKDPTLRRLEAARTNGGGRADARLHPSRRNRATRAGESIRSRVTPIGRNSSAIGHGSFIRARFAASNTRRRFFSTGPAIICARA